MHEDLLPALKSFGFTTNEAKAYLSLLHHNPATGYEISGNSGIPRSAIYEILKRLETTGMVSRVDTNPTRYIPLPPDQLYELLESNFDANLETLKKTLKAVNSEMEVGDLWNIRGYDNLISRSRSMIQAAEETIYVSMWRAEYDRLFPDLQAAVERGVKLVIFSFCDIPATVGEVYAYNLDEAKLEQVWSKKYLLVVDRSNALLGGVEMTPTNKVAWTRNPAIVSIAMNYIILDLTLFGQRYKLNLSGVISNMLEGDIHILDELLDEKHVPVINGLENRA